MVWVACFPRTYNWCSKCLRRSDYAGGGAVTVMQTKVDGGLVDFWFFAARCGSKIDSSVAPDANQEHELKIVGDVGEDGLKSLTLGGISFPEDVTNSVIT